MCCIQEEYARNQSPTLSIFRPNRIISFRIEEDEPNWSDTQLASLRQISFFDSAPERELEKIPFKFRYAYECDHDSCNGHSMICTDWEMGQAYRKWLADYGDSWREKFLLKFEDEMINRLDTHFFVGTVNNHPGTWIIIGLFYPPVEVQPRLL